MAIEERVDYVFVPEVDVVLEKATFVGTKELLCVIPHQRDVDRGFWTEVLRDDRLIETFTPGGTSVAQALRAVLTDASTTLESLRGFLKELSSRWESTVFHEIADIKVLKVKAGWLGGSIVAKLEGKKLYTPLVTQIKKPHRQIVRDFYEDVMARLNQRG